MEGTSQVSFLCASREHVSGVRRAVVPSSTAVRPVWEIARRLYNTKTPRRVGLWKGQPTRGAHSYVGKAEGVPRTPSP